MSRKIGIIGAMEEEVRVLRERMPDMRCETHAGMEFCAGRIDGTEAVLVRSGIGKVNAAICAEILIDRYEVTHILNTGIAGSLNAEIDIGDAVVSTDAIYHDVDATLFGYEPGQVPGMKTAAFPSDAEFRQLVSAAIKTEAPEIRLFEGRVVSGDQFISSDRRKEEIVRQFHGLCTEMEGAGIAQAAYLNNVPFVIVRFISDKANSEAEKTYAEIEQEAAERSARITAEVLKHLG